MTDALHAPAPQLSPTATASSVSSGQGGMATVYLAMTSSTTAGSHQVHESGARRCHRRPPLPQGDPDHRPPPPPPHPSPPRFVAKLNGHLYYVIPYIEGESLRARLDRENQLPWTRRSASPPRRRVRSTTPTATA